VSGGCITLGDVVEHTMILVVACSRCKREDRYKLDVLLARHGGHFSIPTMLRHLSADCSKRKSLSADDLCGVYCPQLPGFFLPQ
jgi:hypothetical protein